jgi:AcrR family transcriptional regulator
MGQAQFEDIDFIAAAHELMIAHGPAAVTVAAITERLGAPTGSFYHRFASRDVLLAELWLATVFAFQEGLIAAIEAEDGLAAALHTPRWARAHPGEASFLLLHRRDDFVRGNWPASLRKRVAEQGRQVEAGLKTFARLHLGGTGAEQLRRAQFVLVDVPLAAVRPHLESRETPPTLVDDLVASTYRAIVDGVRGRGITKSSAPIKAAKGS